MSSLVFLVPLALVLGGAALGAFLWTLRSGQYDDLEGAAERILIDEEDDDAGAGNPKAGEDVNRETAGPARRRI
ncbi:cbb3-type cytochrome oxidase assembly protein CcoS [Chelatococcus asaccharovorans]|uniref:cbb3-type cytochrome oxidase assembly protein CcoS n=1 Tax=Chelatococcus asaccharovorans TaxID=28210 RepID=UPI00224C740A|nr:Cytochrome oxidase maturation protein, cbb3-type [Chelatococcus asaccharovorans]CAH1689288.1 Cytochrome oxidase maturation protein, cbb3-type [Chelatococcus asaccharovorans]